MVRALVHKHNMCFSTHDEIGCLKDVTVNLEMKENFKEFLIRPYPISANLVEKVHRELKKLENHQIIERGPAKCFSPSFARPKPDGKNLRLLLDLRVLNSMMAPKYFSLLTKPELHVKLACQKSVHYLSALDQRASKSREETAIATVGKLISILHLVAGPRTRHVMMTSQSKKNDFFSSGTNLQMSPL